MITSILFLLTVHWIADFVGQDETWSIEKSSNIGSLLAHTTMYSATFLLLMIGFTTEFWNSFLFAIITFVVHTVTDYFTSRIVSKRFENEYYGSEIPNFGAFTMIGLDQLLHFYQLIITYKLLFV